MQDLKLASFIPCMNIIIIIILDASICVLANDLYPLFSNRTIISKDQISAPPYPNIFHLIIQDYNLTFHYVPIGRNTSLTVTYTLIQSQSEKLHPDEWHFITVSVIDKELSYYIDGELMTANSVTLSGSINDPGGTVRIGQSYAGKELKLMLRTLATCRALLVKGTANQSKDFSDASMLNIDACMSDY